MIKTEKVIAETDVVTEYICDICGKRFDVKVDKDMIEIQEFQNIRFIGGYGSIFGDGTVCSIDICQHCFSKKLGEYVKMESPFVSIPFEAKEKNKES